MAYGICRCAKVSGASSGSGAYIHNERKKDHSNSNPDIDFEASELNYSHGAYDSKLTYNERAEKRIEEGYTGKRAVRKDAVKMVEFLFASSDAESLDNHAAYLRECYKWLCDRYGKENVIADTVHLDEKTPHLHAVIVPLTEDGRLSCKEVIGGPKQLQEMQDDFFEKVSSKFGLERGEKADLQNPDRETKKHVPQMQFKKQTLAKLDEEITDKEKELKSAEMMNRFTQKKNEKLFQTQDSLMALQESLDKQIKEKEKELEKTSERLSEAQKDLKRVQGRIYTESEREIDLRADNEGLKDENDRLSAEVNSLTDKFEALKDDFNNLDGVMEYKQEELKTLESSIKSKENAFQSITQKITNYFEKIFSVVEMHINKAREVAPTSSERANDSLDRAELGGRGALDKAKEQGLPKELAEEAKEAISEKVEKAAEEIAEQVPTFRRRRGR